MKRIIIFVAILSSIFAVSCTSTQGNYTIISSKDLDLSKKYVKTVENVNATSTVHIVIFFPYGPLSEGLYTAALKDAESKSNIDYIANAEVKLTSWYIPLIYGKTEISILGDGYQEQE